MAAPLILSDLRGGLHDSDTIHDLRPDQLSICQNVDLNRASCGGKRRGTSPKSNDYAGAATKITFLFRHFPSNDEALTELWAAGPVSTSGAIDYRDTTGWHAAAFSPDGFIAASGTYGIDMQSLHGKLFVAYPAASGGVPVDRLHIRHSSGGLTTLRRAGLAEPAAPTLGETGSAGSYDGVRYARVRYTVQESGTTLRRSEPSDAATITPSGTKTGIVVTRPALLGEGETHWEVELSLDNVNFYRVSTVAVATTTYTDTVSDDTGYAADGVLSADIGDYTPPWSAKFLFADDDRLILAGSWVDDTKKSRVGWTPPALAEGVGNDERLEEDVDPFLDLDGYEGGEITCGTKSPVFGFFHLFKHKHVYRLARTGVRARAYDAIALTKQKGAMPRSAVVGVDEVGNPCTYFADPDEGPHRIGSRGIEDIGDAVQNTWNRVNKNAALPCHSVFYPEAKQWWLWVALDAAETPSHVLVLHAKYGRRGEDGVVRGWSLYTGKVAKALAACMYAENVDVVPGVAQSKRLGLFVGFDEAVASGEARLQRADTGVSDDGETYRAYLRTRPFLTRELLGKAGVMSASVMAPVSSGDSVDVTLIRDFGVNTKTVAASLTATASERRIVRHLDNLDLSEMMALEVEIGDTAATSGSWAVDQLSFRQRGEESF
jgi:hypothetical protein